MIETINYAVITSPEDNQMDSKANTLSRIRDMESMCILQILKVGKMEREKEF